MTTPESDAISALNELSASDTPHDALDIIIEFLHETHPLLWAAYKNAWFKCDTVSFAE